MTGWFKVDRDGLRKIIERRGKSIIISELLQNAWDESSTRVTVTLVKIPGRPLAHLVVKDDNPDGFHDLSHAYTMFAESKKKGDPSKRGFMDLGEKLVLSLCKSAEIRSTTGSVHFHEDDTMSKGRHKTERGSVFEADVRLNQSEFDEVLESFWQLIPTGDCVTTLNGEELPTRTPITTFEAKLQTTRSDEEGVMRKTVRKTKVEIYDITDKDREGQMGGWIYEMGIPVVPTGDRYHVNVMQRVPVNMERDNVPPSYLKKLRAEVLNKTVALLTKDEVSEGWVTNALESDDIEDEAVVETLDKRFGKKRASFDPSDNEANMNLTGQGYTVVHGPSLPKAAWGNVRRAGAIKSSGKIAPTPKPYSDDPNAKPVEVISRSDWNQGMRDIDKVVREMAGVLLDKPDILVRYVKPNERWWAAAWTGGIDWNLSSLGWKYFQSWREYPERIVNTVIHEFAHGKAGNHLDENFHKACTRYGAQLAMAIAKRELPFLTKALRDAE